MSPDFDVVIASACRTPIGAFMGALSAVSPVQLAALTIQEANHRAGVAPEQVDEVIVGSVLTAGLGQNVARQAATAAGLPVTVPAEARDTLHRRRHGSVRHRRALIRTTAGRKIMGQDHGIYDSALHPGRCGNRPERLPHIRSRLCGLGRS